MCIGVEIVESLIELYVITFRTFIVSSFLVSFAPMITFGIAILGLISTILSMIHRASVYLVDILHTYLKFVLNF